MICGKSVLAIIPARGGSKGLAGKNIMPIHGKPLLAWSIAAGLKSKYVDDVTLTTDSAKIRKIGLAHGAQAPFLRPAHLATDKATSFDAIEHAVRYYSEKLGKDYDYIVLLEPTSPLRETCDIDRPLEILTAQPKADAIVGICRSESAHPFFTVQKNAKGFISGYMRRPMKSLRRQDVPAAYFFEGTIYISKTDVLLKKKSFYHDHTLGYEVPRWKSLEIDDIHDWVMAQALMQYRKYR